MRNKRILFKTAGVIMAIIGAVIVIHTVPVFIWYIALIVLVMIFAYFMLTT